MKTMIIGVLLLISQLSMAAESCRMGLMLADDASTITASFIDQPDEYFSYLLEGDKNCAEHFLTFLKEGSKFMESEGENLPVVYQYVLKKRDREKFLKAVAENAKIGGFEVVIDEATRTVRAKGKDL